MAEGQHMQPSSHWLVGSKWWQILMLAVIVTIVMFILDARFGIDYHRPVQAVCIAVLTFVIGLGLIALIVEWVRNKVSSGR
jgi:hypothetical protein